jgi:ABC-2 type transport system permease protein
MYIELYGNITCSDYNIAYFLKFALGIYLGENFFKIYLIFLLASLSFISMGIAVSSIAKSVLQACFVGIFITLPMSFIGGCWWRNDYSTDLIKTAGRFTPVYWVMNGVTKMLNNMSLSDIKWELLFIIAFSAIFFIMGTWKREEIIA